ncbi:MAG: response regulator [bacterium]|nr:response regulator [bacterium]
MSIDRILVVDDDPQLLPSFKRALSEAGYEVAAANNGKKALELLQSKTFELILTDIVMEGINGLQLLQEVRKMSLITPVILITGFSSIKNAEDAIRYGATDYLVKPCKKSEIKRRVSLAIEKARMEESLKMDNCLENTQGVLDMFAKYLDIPIENMEVYAQLLSSSLVYNNKDRDDYALIHTGKQIDYWVKRMAETTTEMRHFSKKIESIKYDTDQSKLMDKFTAIKYNIEEDMGVNED